MKYPKHCHFKARNLAFVEVAGKRLYVGEYDSPESRTEFQRALTELHLHRHGPLSARSAFDARQALSINQLLLAYLQHAQGYYADRNPAILPGTPIGLWSPCAHLGRN